MPKRRISKEIKECRGIVLDIGAADGWLGQHLDSTEKYISLDYPDTAIGLYGVRPHIFADACRMPIADASVGAVACYEVLEHVRQPAAVLAEVRRILVPGGVAEFTMPFLYPIHDAPHDYQRWTQHGWLRSIERAGLVLDEIEPRGHALRAAAIIMCLGLAGPFRNSRPAMMLLGLPVLLALLPAINLSAAVLSSFWPSWDAMTVGYRILVRKPTA